MSTSDHSMGIRLRVVKSLERDAYRKTARLSVEAMRKLGINSGDFIEVEGPGGTEVLRAMLAEMQDSWSISLDKSTRDKLGVKIGDYVTARPIQVDPATKVVFEIVNRPFFQEEFLPRLLKEKLYGLPVRKGETLSIPVREYGLWLEVRVAGTSPSPVVYITEDTDVSVVVGKSTFEAEGIPKVTWEDVGDLEEAKRRLREVVILPMKYPEIFKKLGIDPPKGVLLYGPPGTGKTLLAKALANEVGAYFIAINGPEIMSKFYGESEERLRKVFEEARRRAPSIIFIDEIDSIAPKREEVTGEVEKRVVSQLLTLMDGLEARGEVVVIAATNRPDALDPALRRPGRFDIEIEIPPPDKRARKEILLVHTRRLPLDKDVDIDALASVTHGYTGADLAALVREAAMNALRRFMEEEKIDLISTKGKQELPPEKLEKLKITMKDFEVALRTIQPSLLREVFVEVPEVRWEDIGGLEDVKQELRESIEWPLKYPDVISEMGIEPPKGILLFGPPGTGKTLLAKAVATESGANFIAVRGPEILSKWVGESEKAIRQIFRRARMVAPAVIFFDEIDSIAAMRGTDTSGVIDRIVNQLLTELDGLSPLRKVVVIGTTNRPDLLDPALLRPGRFDRLVYVPPPDYNARLEIFKIHTRRIPLGDDVDLGELAKRTDGYTGADIAAICREAAMMALRDMYRKTGRLEKVKVGMDYFLQALNKVPPSLSRTDIEIYERLAKEMKKMSGVHGRRPSLSYG